MNTSSTKIRVWDAPVRVFHWLMVLSFAGAYLSAESERWRLIHITLGYTLGGLVVFRVVWGMVGTRYARFSSFVRGPAAVWRYLRSLLTGPAEHHIGHNPAGAVAIVLMLFLSAIMVVTGWASYNDVGGDWLGDGHELAANGMLLVVFVHIAGVVVASWLHRENLVRAMLTGFKRGAWADGITQARHVVAALILGVVLVFWWWQWDTAPRAGSENAAQMNALQLGARDNEESDD